MRARLAHRSAALEGDRDGAHRWQADAEPDEARRVRRGGVAIRARRARLSARGEVEIVFKLKGGEDGGRQWRRRLGGQRRGDPRAQLDEVRHHGGLSGGEGVGGGGRIEEERAEGVARSGAHKGRHVEGAAREEREHGRRAEVGGARDV